MYLIQDIETIPETEIQHLNETPEGDFPPIHFHKVLCIGALFLNGNLHPSKDGLSGSVLSEGADGGKSEKNQIQKWSEVVDNNGKPLQMVDWNGRHFDVPVLQTRALALGIPLPWYFQPPNPTSKWSKAYRDRYGGKHLDLAEEWTNRGAFRKPSLLHITSLMGLPGKVGIDGSKVHEAYLAGRLKEIDVYCMQDVIQTAFLFQRYKYITGDVTLPNYREATQALLDWTAKQSDQLEFLETINQDKLLLL